MAFPNFMSVLYSKLYEMYFFVNCRHCGHSESIPHSFTKRENFSRHLLWSRVMMGRPICWKLHVICLLLPEQSLLWRCWSTWTGSPFKHCYYGCYRACSPPPLNHRGIFQNLVHFLRHWEPLNGPGKYSRQVWITTDPNFIRLFPGFYFKVKKRTRRDLYQLGK